jgi:hypothetical protein
LSGIAVAGNRWAKADEISARTQAHKMQIRFMILVSVVENRRDWGEKRKWKSRVRCKLIGKRSMISRLEILRS